MSLRTLHPTDEYVHPGEQHPALIKARRDLAYFDTWRDTFELRDRVHALIRLGLTTDEIAKRLGVSDRTVQRLKHREPAPQRPQLPAGVDDSRAGEIEKTALLALRLAEILRDEDPNLVWTALSKLDRQALQELAVIALAAVQVPFGAESAEAVAEQMFSWVLELPVAEMEAS